ncbi:MAG: DUF6702 family protein [Croceivirga sp.]
MGKFFCTIVFYLIIITTSRAHNPNEVSYFFKLESEELVIHLTPKSCVDILETLHPNLKNQSTFSLQTYTTDIEEYFKKHILFYVNGQSVPLKLTKTDMNVHDATLTFTIQNTVSESKNLDITISSFVDIYKKVKNHVFIYGSGIKKHCVLDSKTKHISGEFPSGAPTPLNLFFWLPLTSLSFMPLSIGFAVHRKQKSRFKPFQSI